MGVKWRFQAGLCREKQVRSVGCEDIGILVKWRDSRWCQGQAVSERCFTELQGFLELFSIESCRVKAVGAMKVFWSMCLATRALGRFIHLRLFLRRGFPRSQRPLVQAVMGALSTTASVLCIVGIPICFMAAHKSSPPSPPAHPRAAVGRCRTPCRFTLEATSEANAVYEGGEAVAAGCTVPFPMCVTVSAQAPGEGCPVCSTW